jgi:hypothetical protein
MIKSSGELRRHRARQPENHPTAAANAGRPLARPPPENKRFTKAMDKRLSRPLREAIEGALIRHGQERKKSMRLYVFRSRHLDKFLLGNTLTQFAPGASAPDRPRRFLNPEHEHTKSVCH